MAAHTTPGHRPDTNPRDFEPEILRPIILTLRRECFEELEPCAIQRWNLSIDDTRRFQRAIVSDLVLTFKTANEALDALGGGLVYEFLRLKCWNNQWTQCDFEGKKAWAILVCQRELIQSFRIPKKASSANTIRSWARDFNARHGLSTSLTQHRAYVRGRSDAIREQRSESSSETAE